MLREINNLTGLLACEKQKKQTTSRHLPTLNIIKDSHPVDSHQSQYPVCYQPPSLPSHAIKQEDTNPSCKNPGKIAELKRNSDHPDKSAQ